MTKIDFRFTCIAYRQILLANLTFVVIYDFNRITSRRSTTVTDVGLPLKPLVSNVVDPIPLVISIFFILQSIHAFTQPDDNP